MNFKQATHPRIAVVSLAGIFPGAPSADRFISNVLDKQEAVVRVPDQRWTAPVSKMLAPSPGAPIPDRAASDRAGLILDFQFDPEGYHISPGLLAALDPVHHLVLSAGKDALDQCRLTPDMKKRTGVVLAAIALPTPGANRITREIFCAGTTLSPAAALAGSMVSAPAGILARALGLEGGCHTLDAACASSLFAVKLACEQLTAGTADVMVAGGVSRPDALYTQVGFTQLQALSPTGRCAPFDRTADGLVVGEGAGIVVLKRLEDAVAHRDTIHGIITGWGVSNDIEGNLVAPSSDGQIRAMVEAYKMAGWSPADIQYMECHGSGTPKGDRVELASIRTLADRFKSTASALALGSVKSMVGHLLTAAGAAGFIKTLMAMERETLPPSLNFTALPEDSPIRDTGITVQSDPSPWAPAAPSIPRRAGISAFGFGGINAHILVEAWDAGTRVHAVPVALSPQPCAIVGMDVLSGSARNLDEFRDLLFGAASLAPEPGKARWRPNRGLPRDLLHLKTWFLKELDLDLTAFHIPPNQIGDILPQHLAMLIAARGALLDAGIPSRPGPDDPDRSRTGCAVGIDFDFGASDFYLRWRLHRHSDPVLDQIGPPLNFDRTLGALGGIVASRLARAFKLGGPCFTLSAGAVSGIKAIEIGCRSLARRETDLFICAAVDLAGDIRTTIRDRALNGIDPGVIPSEGAAALVLKRLDDAISAGDRIYGVVTGTGSASAAPVAGEQDATGTKAAYALSLERALEQSGRSLAEIGMASVLNTRANAGGRAEIDAVARLAGTGKVPKIFCPAAVVGATGAASALFSTVAAGLCQHHCKPPRGTALNSPDLRYAAVGARTWDGACAHLILEQGPAQKKGSASKKTDRHPPAASKTTLAVPVVRPPLAPEILDLIGADVPVSSQPVSSQPFKPAQPRAGTVSAVPGLMAQTQETTARAHERFLELSARNMDEMGKQLLAMAGTGLGAGTESLEKQTPVHRTAPAPKESGRVFFDREQCLEFARGKAGNVLGPEFDIIDTYPVRVRLPDEPLMLVDRIINIQGEMLSLGPGKIVTQHDVKEGAWYLDGGKTPVSISIEAGQADLFLCAWLGIDHVVKGLRRYRLLDARVTFHRSLPVPGETIEYHIEIDRFLKQGDIYLFFFHYRGYIDGLPLISMRDGCAGFFTEPEVENSGGIILKKEDKEMQPPGHRLAPLVEMARESYDDTRVEALRRGDLETAFGPAFAGKVPGKNQWLPGGPMTLIHRVLDLDPSGGRFGAGRIVAEADIHPDDWFLTCHFVDDMVMPGTLMYECCAHTLRVFVQRMGWILPDPDICYDVLPDNESDLKCRGPVTCHTARARYDIEIKQIGYTPEPYVIADAHMFSDDLQIVYYKDMGMKLAGATQETLSAFWRKR